MPSSQYLAALAIVGAVIIAAPFVILLVAKLAAYGWYRGKQNFENDCKKNHKENRDNG